MPDAVTAQTDFSAGELDDTAKRDEIAKTGARQMANWRVTNTKKATNRPGRRAVFIDSGGVGGRVDKVQMAPGSLFYLCFGADAVLRVRNAAGAIVFSSSGVPFTIGGVDKVVWEVYGNSIYLTMAGAIPQVLTWDGVSTWSLSNLSPLTGSDGKKRTLFYKLAPPNVKIQPSGATGGIFIFSNVPYFTVGMATNNIVVRWHGRQIRIDGFIGSTQVTGTVIEPLQQSQQIQFLNAINAAEGDVVVGQTSGARGIVDVWVNQFQFNVVNIGASLFVNGEVVIAPNGSGVTNAVTPISPTPTLFWDEEIMNGFRGWPKSCFVDQNRFGLCDFPALPAAIGWSRVAVFNDFLEGAEAADPIFELAPDKAQVRHVMSGMESSEFVFCDNAIYYIPISVTNPLRPGSVQFVKLSSDGSSTTKPRAAQNFIAYVNSSGNAIGAVLPLGAQTRPYVTRDLTELHAHLFANIKALAIPTTTDPNFKERYIYALNADGSLVMGKLNTKEGKIAVDDVIGWLPWSGEGAVNWVHALAADVIFQTRYAPGSATPVAIVEALDNTMYLDGAMMVNAAPTAFAPPVGKGPLWWLANGTVMLMDQSTRMMTTYSIDANGNIIPQGLGGEDLSLASLVAGQMWTATLEPFIPPAPPGQDVGQRMKPRRLIRFDVYVQQSSGFVLKRLYGGKTGPNLPAPGTVMTERRIPMWNQGENPTLPPTLREWTYSERPSGRSYDPREAVVKDTPGPLLISEIATEVTV